MSSTLVGKIRVFFFFFKELALYVAGRWHSLRVLVSLVCDVAPQESRLRSTREDPEAAWFRRSLGRALGNDGYTGGSSFLQQYLEKALLKTHQGFVCFCLFSGWRVYKVPDKNVLFVTTAKAGNWGVQM